MTYRGPARTRPARPMVLVATAAVIIGVLGYQSWATSSPLDEADGAVPDGVTVFDDEVPAVANLDPGLVKALREAATDAADDSVTFHVNSGWRSPEYQNQLLHEAISTYGSEREAARWVATPDTSLHVSGDAIDIGPTDAAAWLSEYGADYGLCQIYRNEPWHYELHPDAVDHGCPRRYADPTQDPRSGGADHAGRSAHTEIRGTEDHADDRADRRIELGIDGHLLPDHQSAGA